MAKNKGSVTSETSVVHNVTDALVYSQVKNNLYKKDYEDYVQNYNSNLGKISVGKKKIR